MMNSAIAAITVRENTEELARQALPDAPTVPERDDREPAMGFAVVPLRKRASLTLRRLADRLDAPSTGHSQLPGGAS